MKCKPAQLTLLIFLFSSLFSFAQEKAATTKELLEKHVKALSATETAGRMPGSEGINIAKKYIIDEFKSAEIISLSPGGYSSDFEVIIKNKFLKEKSSLTIHDLNESKDIISESFFQPIFSSENTACKNREVVFVGYGITDNKIQYDDYSDIDVKDKIVLMLRYDYNESIQEKYTPSENASWKSKFQLAKSKGAAAVILFNGFGSKLNGIKDTVQNQKYNFFLKDDDNKIHFIHAKQTFISEIEKITKINFFEIQKGIDQNKKPNSFVLPKLKLSLDVNFDKNIVTTSNVVAFIPGADPELKKEYIVIGAHYDHVGLGTFGSRTYINNSNTIHPGADDNASGSSALIEIGKYLKTLKLKRSVLLIGFSAEEMGLFGSINFLIQNNKIINSIKAMINLDMIGNYRDFITVRVNGIDTSKDFRSIFESVPSNELKFTYTLYSPENGLSDHANFFAKNIPSVHYFTGFHERYHHPSDTADTINYEGLAKITQHAANFAEKLCNWEGEILFNKEYTPKPLADPGINCTTDNGHIKIISLDENFPGAKAGLKVGDLILEIDHIQVKSVMDYFTQIRDYNADSKIVFVISRETNSVTETLEVTLNL